MKKPLLSKIIFAIVVLGITAAMIFPFLWMLMSSIKTQIDIISWPPKFIFTPTLANYAKVFG